MKQVRGIMAVLEMYMKQVGGIRAVHYFSKAALLGMSWWFGMFCVWMCKGLMGSLGLMGISHRVYISNLFSVGSLGE